MQGRIIYKEPAAQQALLLFNRFEKLRMLAAKN
jgi:hypothetical protein